MNLGLAREIYGGTPWYMDSLSMLTLGEMLKMIRSGSLGIPEEKANSQFFIPANAVKIADAGRLKQLEDNGNQYISITNLDGVLTKNGGDSSYGTKTLANRLLQADKEKQVIGHIIISDSGGGSSNAVPEMRDAFDMLTKPKIGFIDGMSASAAYYIISKLDYIIAHRADDIVGSIGTMIEFSAPKQNFVDKESEYQNVRVYADASTLKNKMFEDAVNKLDFTLVKEKLLNPLNNTFISDVKNDRPNVLDSQLSGDTFYAKEVVGTMIDSIGTFETAVNKIIELSNQNINLSKSNIMNKTELKQNHPDLYNEVLSEGIAQEKDRVGAILVFNDVDPKAVSELIESGEKPSQKFMAEMSRKALAKDMLTSAKNESVTEINTVIENTVPKNDELESAKAEAFKAAGLNIEK